MHASWKNVIQAFCVRPFSIRIHAVFLNDIFSQTCSSIKSLSSVIATSLSTGLCWTNSPQVICYKNTPRIYIQANCGLKSAFNLKWAFLQQI